MALNKSTRELCVTRVSIMQAIFDGEDIANGNSKAELVLDGIAAAVTLCGEMMHAELREGSKAAREKIRELEAREQALQQKQKRLIAAMQSVASVVSQVSDDCGDNQEQNAGSVEHKTDSEGDDDDGECGGSGGERLAHDGQGESEPKPEEGCGDGAEVAGSSEHDNGEEGKEDGDAGSTVNEAAESGSSEEEDGGKEEGEEEKPKEVEQKAEPEMNYCERMKLKSLSPLPCGKKPPCFAAGGCERLPFGAKKTDIEESPIRN